MESTPRDLNPDTSCQNEQENLANEKLLKEGNPKRSATTFSSERMETQRQWKIIQSGKSKNFQPRISYAAKLTFKK